MKKILLTLATITVSITLQAQTTVEEYNYVSKGYKVQLESGLDMKKGYEMIDLNNVAIGVRTGELKKLVKVTGSQKKTVAHLIIYSSDGGTTKQYICVPYTPADAEPTAESISLDELYTKGLYSNYNFGDQATRLQVIAYLLSSTLK